MGAGSGGGDCHCRQKRRPPGHDLWPCQPKQIVLWSTMPDIKEQQSHKVVLVVILLLVVAMTRS